MKNVPKPDDFRLHTRVDGLRVEVAGYAPVDVALCPTGFRIRKVTDDYRQLHLFTQCGLDCDYDCGCEYRCQCNCEGCDGYCHFSLHDPEDWFPYLGVALPHYRSIPRQVAAHCFLYGQSRPQTTPMQIMTQTLGRSIAAHCEKLLGRADKKILAAQSSVCRACRRVENIFLDSRIYRNHYLAKDIATYRAAAISVTLAPYVQYDRTIETGRHWKSRCSLQEWVFEALENWQAVLSPTGRTYRSLSRTLMHLPGNIPVQLLRVLSAVRLERPILDRVELIALLMAQEHLYSVCAEQNLNKGNVERFARAANVRIFLHASRSEIYRVMQTIGNELRCKLSPRRLGDIESVVRYLMDYPDVHNGRLQGLARKSIDWHQDDAIYELDGEASSYLDQSTVRPPIELPKDPNITFLESIRDIYREGKCMNHCVGGLADGAADGRCYLFHCEHQEQRATVQVNTSGRVIEASGPCNHWNQACVYGRKILSRWGKTLSDQVRRSLK